MHIFGPLAALTLQLKPFGLSTLLMITSIPRHLQFCVQIILITKVLLGIFNVKNSFLLI